uniref:CCHC-type domain-containing protein n=1 Tax=Meloidogyne javanica TaxID=6303 RepID=A0A915N9H5_MELJA
MLLIIRTNLTISLAILIISPNFPSTILADKLTTKTASLDGEKLKTQLLESLNSYGKSRGSEEFLEPIGNKNPKKLFLDAQTTFKAFEHLDNLNNSSSMLTENEKSKQAKTLGEWRRKIYKFLGLNKRKEEKPALTTTKQSPLVLHDDELDSTPLPIFMEKEDEDNLCNHYKRKDQQKFQNKIIRLAPIQPIFTSVKENPLHWNFGNFKNKENPGGCGGDEQQQLTLMPLEQENRLKASADKTRNLQIPLPSIQQQPPPQLSPLQFPPPPPQLPPQPLPPPPLIQPFLPLQFPNNLFPTLPSLITTPPFQPTSFVSEMIVPEIGTEEIVNNLNIQGNVLATDEPKEQEIKIKMDVNAGTGKEIEPETHESSTGINSKIVDFRVKVEIKKNLLVGMLMFCLFGVLMAAPGNYSPLSTPPENQWDSLLDEIEAFEPQMVENAGEGNIQEGPRTPPENNQEERKAKRAKLENLFESWLANRCTTASNVCSTSALGGQTTQFAGPSSTTTNTFIPSTSVIGTTTMQYLSTASSDAPRTLASFKIPKIKKEEIGGSPNCFNKRPHSNYIKSCFLCGNKQHLAKNCPLANCGQQNNQIAPSHQNNSIPPNAAENLARDLTELAQRHPAPLATLLFQLARVLLLTTQAARQQ